MNWIKVFTREYSVQYVEAAIRALGKDAAHLLTFTTEDILILPTHGNCQGYILEESYKKLITSIKKQFTSSQEKFNSFVALLHKLGKEYISFGKSLEKEKLKAMSQEALLSCFKDYLQKYLDYSTIGAWAAHLLNVEYTQVGQSIAKEYDDKIREALFRPTRKSTILLMQEEALLIKGDKEKEKLFWQKYQWLPCLDVQNTAWSFADAQEFISSVRPAIVQERLSFERACTLAELSSEQIALFEMIRELGYLKDARDDYRRQGVFYAQVLYEEIAERLALTRQDVAYMTTQEILSGQVDREEITRRKEKGFLLYVKEGITYCSSQDIEELLLTLGFVKEEKKVDELKGIVASKGKVTGPVRIVRIVHDTLKVKKGDVLVAVTTHPDYVPAMQRAVAIVTDEGGILSHAAIVSRELGIPCIVGTHQATQVLENGQIVEVDAEVGVVRIIEEK